MNLVFLTFDATVMLVDNLNLILASNVLLSLEDNIGALSFAIKIYIHVTIALYEYLHVIYIEIYISLKLISVSCYVSVAISLLDWGQ